MSVVELSNEQASEMMNPKTNDEKREELKNYLKLAHKLPSFLFQSTDIGLALPKTLTEEQKKECYRIVREFLTLMKTKQMKVDGKEWSSGCFGSRWYDIEDEKYECRCAFYSKKFAENWEYEKPYILQFHFDEKTQ